MVLFLAAMSYKGEPRDGCGRPAPKRDATWAVSAGPAAIHRHPQQGHEALHQATDSQAKKLLSFYARTQRKSLPAYARSSTDLTTL